MISHSHCHYALTFSGKRGRPRRYKDGDIVYLARMLNGTEYAIFGSAITYSHVDERDVASDEDIKQIYWRSDWPIYIRIYKPVFVDGVMGDCPKMSQLIDDLKHDCFDNTQRTFNANNQDEINPWLSLVQQADVRLSELGAQWVEQELKRVINKVGTVPEGFISSLYTPVVEGLT